MFSLAKHEGGNYVLTNPVSECSEINKVADVVNCDHGLYLPNQTTQPDIVGLRTFNIGRRLLVLHHAMSMVSVQTVHVRLYYPLFLSRLK